MVETVVRFEEMVEAFDFTALLVLRQALVLDLLAHAVGDGEVVQVDLLVLPCMQELLLQLRPIWVIQILCAGHAVEVGCVLDAP